MMAITFRSICRSAGPRARADAGRGQRGENRNGVDVALIEAPPAIDRHQGRQNEQRLVRQGGLEGFRRALKARFNARRQAELLSGLVDDAHRLPQETPGAG